MSKKAIAAAGLASLTLVACGEQVQLVQPAAAPAEPETQIEQVVVPAVEPGAETPATAKPAETKPATEPVNTPAKAPATTPAPAETPAASTETQPADQTAAPTAESAAAQTFTKSAKYSSPGGEHTIAVTVQLSAGRIAAISMTGDIASKTSQRFEQEFAASVANQLIGKTIEEAQTIGTVAGASLTSAAFRDALSRVQSAAVAG